MRPSTNRWLSSLLLVVILGAGVGIGVALDRLWLQPDGGAAPGSTSARAWRSRDPATRAARLSARFRKKLGLDAQQEQAVRATLKHMYEKTGALRKQRRQELRQIRDASRAEIRKVLTAAQQQQFQKMVDAYEKRRAKRRRRRHR